MKTMEIRIYFAKTAKTELIIDKLESYLNYTFGGYTAYYGNGGYIGEILTEYKEESFIYEILTAKLPFDWQNGIKELFIGSGEESILITEKLIDKVEFIAL